MDKKIPDASMALGELVLRLAAVERATKFPDGTTPESDTDHTVMLGIIACAFAASEARHLDIGKIAQFALVHDLVEAYAGDTNTFGMHGDSDKKKEKDAREAAALKRIEEEFKDVLPWVPETIEEYESLSSPEARYIKTLDKAMPKITHALNKGTELPNLDAFNEHVTHQEKIFVEGYGKDQPEAIELYKALAEKARVGLSERLSKEN